MRVIIVHNPKAGDDGPSSGWLIDTVQRHGHQAQYVTTGDHAWREAIDESVELVAVAGGDGSVDDVARVIAGRPILLAVLPLGTANNVATALAVVDTPVERLIAGWADAARCRFDIGVAQGRWGTFRFLEGVGVGLLAEGMADIDKGAAAHVNTLPRGDARIAAALEVFQSQLRTCPPRRVDLVVDGRDLSGEYLMVEVLNFGTAGPNLHLSPTAEAADGLLDVVLVGERERPDLIRVLSSPGAVPGGASALPVHRGRHVTLSCERVALHVDDRIWQLSAPETGSTVDLRVDRAALTFLVPARSPSE
jgi:diacylglycerol kinase family enzyme